MKTINKPGDNLGGLVKIWAIPNDSFWISGTTLNLSDHINVYEIYCTPGSMGFAEPKEESDAGIHYNTEIQGFIPGDSEATRTAINYLERRKWVVLFKDGNGKYKLAGSSYQAMKAYAQLDTGNDTPDRAGYNLSFSGKTKERAVFVDNPF